MVEQKISKENGVPTECGLIIKVDTIADGTVFAASSFTKNTHYKRDPDMHLGLNGPTSYPGWSPHMGGDAEADWVCKGCGTLVNVIVVAEDSRLLHGEVTVAFFDMGCQAIQKLPDAKVEVI